VGLVLSWTAEEPWLRPFRNLEDEVKVELERHRNCCAAPLGFAGWRKEETAEFHKTCQT
jgi:hypothetical protein